ncbi:hypothetical protein Syun_014892 [Stephania yunnanensis]|uniref:Uncharacterized protein n=1 Tax=Stephania yunnanensis TaxID=152371 RepID=A0AAP0P975_9MAGN
MNQVNLLGLDMDVLPKKSITEELIERYGRVNGYEDAEDERERVKIARREIEQRTKIKYDTRRILEEMSEVKNVSNMEQPTMDYDKLYKEEQMTTLCNQELVFENQRALTRSIHEMEQFVPSAVATIEALSQCALSVATICYIYRRRLLCPSPSSALPLFVVFFAHRLYPPPRLLSASPSSALSLAIVCSVPRRRLLYPSPLCIVVVCSVPHLSASPSPALSVVVVCSYLSS